MSGPMGRTGTCAPSALRSKSVSPRTQLSRAGGDGRDTTAQRSYPARDEVRTES
ncbi:MAG TPA: hypothetical protein VHG93_17210 [Longimicrobium sp.]|nr:hypothetical protein [Longimicrobium sp.]